jgi:hypothetical protein
LKIIIKKLLSKKKIYLDIDNIFSKKIDFNHKLNDILIQYREEKTYNTSDIYLG